MKPDQVHQWLTGPSCLLALLSILAVTLLIAAALGRLERLASLGTRAVERLGHGRPLLILWGLSAAVLTLLLAWVLIATKILALLGVLILASGLILAGLGLAVTAARLGRSLSAAADASEPSSVLSAALGLTVLFLASFLPVLGWLTVLFALLAGVGATLDALLRRE